MERMTIFKAYDVRGTVPAQLNDRVAYAIGREVVLMTTAAKVVVGMDARNESPALLAALAAGMQAAGAEVLTLGMCGTEEVYAATAAGGHALGVMVTASHNPKGYNGFKLIRAGGEPFTTADLNALEERVRYAVAGVPEAVPAPAVLTEIGAVARGTYVQTVLGFVDAAKLKPMKLAVNCMNGSAGATIKAVLAQLPMITPVYMQDDADGDFPHGLPNPLLPEQRARTADAVREHGADLGVAFDGDFDRCFVFTAAGEFVAPYYMAGLLAQVLLARAPGSVIVHDPRLYWDTQAVIAAHGGVPHVTRAGHLFFKQALRDTGAIYGAETSGHFFFKDFYCCDSGVVPLLLVLQLLSDTSQSLEALVAARRAANPATDETNFKLATPAAEVLAAVQAACAAAVVERIDGVGLTMPTWRANLRASNTEPLLRLNLEAKDAATLKAEHARLVKVIEGTGATLADH